MGSPSSLIDPDALLVADASTVISVNATGCADKILKALPNPVVVVDLVFAELEQGRPKKRQDADLLKTLVDANRIRIVELDEVAVLHFEQLVVGPAISTLDDGEAATIAHALRRGGIPVIDERKAIRLCGERFPELRMACAMDIFAHPNVQTALGNDRLADAVFNALVNGRMRVFLQHVDWVVKLIGIERARLCASLPRSARASVATRQV